MLVSWALAAEALDVPVVQVKEMAALGVFRKLHGGIDSDALPVTVFEKNVLFQRFEAAKAAKKGSPPCA